MNDIVYADLRCHSSKGQIDVSCNDEIYASEATYPVDHEEADLDRRRLHLIRAFHLRREFVL